MAGPGSPFLAKGRLNAVVIAGAVIALLACVAGPWELGRSARRAQHHEACEAMRSLTQGLADRMHAMAASMRGFEQEDRRLAATWRFMDGAIPERHSGGDDLLLQSSANIAASSERTADQEGKLANETDRHAADLDAKVASRCKEDGL